MTLRPRLATGLLFSDIIYYIHPVRKGKIITGLIKDQNYSGIILPYVKTLPDRLHDRYSRGDSRGRCLLSIPTQHGTHQ